MSTEQQHPYWTIGDMVGIASGMGYLEDALQEALRELDKGWSDQAEKTIEWVVGSLHESCDELRALYTRLKNDLEPMYKEDLMRGIRG